MTMLSHYQSIVDRHYKIRDSKLGISGTYLKYLGNSTDPDTRINSIIYDEPVDIVVRIKELSLYELDALARSGIEQVDATWIMRKAYVAEVKPNDVFQIGGDDYYVIDKGVKDNDDMQLAHRIMTRRR